MFKIEKRYTIETPVIYEVTMVSQIADVNKGSNGWMTEEPKTYTEQFVKLEEAKEYFNKNLLNTTGQIHSLTLVRKEIIASWDRK